MPDQIRPQAPQPCPRIAPGFALHRLDDDSLVVVSESRRALIRLKGLGLVAPLIDGGHTGSQIIDQLAGRLDGPQVESILQALARAAYIQLHAPPQSDEARAEQAFWRQASGRDGAAPPLSQVDLVRTASVSLERLERCRQALQLAGIEVQADAALKLVLCDDYRCPELHRLCRQAQQQGRPVLLARPNGLTPSIGPFIELPQSACIDCLRFWIGTQKPLETWLEQQGSPTYARPPLTCGPASEMACHGLLTMAIEHWFSQQDGSPRQAWDILSLDTRTLQTQAHTLVKRPQCPGCGTPDLMTLQAWRQPCLEAAPGQRLEGGYRHQRAQRTYERYRHLVSPLTGPICYLHTMPRRHDGLRQVYVSGYMVRPDPQAPGLAIDKVCAGKGATAEQARTSALCEALERFSGVYQGDEARTRARQVDLAEPSLGFNPLQQFSERQFARRQQINAGTRDVRQQVPLPWDPRTAIDWTPAWSLSQQRWCQVPLAYCYAQAPEESGLAFGIHNPNGTAAGTSVAEALLQGTLELVERDATAIWWYNRLQRPGLDLASFNDPYFNQLAADYAGLGWQLWVLDLTHDLEIPVCAAVAWHPEEDRHALGFGCHLDPHLAVQRALTEVNQLFDPLVRGPDPWNRQLLADASFLQPVGSRSARDFTQTAAQSLEQALDHCQRVFERQGLEWLMVDKTRPDLGLNVVQAIVPGLRHFWPRFAAGRLYDVPCTLGWRTAPIDESELNPAPLFL
ncbi:TOMM precursor leader peptide-binding protein [Pseudomonas sp. QD4]|uniref:TOMM precursor leader peptide-binding protein n=1 Tax=Pseudomonas sp. QD4 TaxID=3368618 RepID=UPI003BA38252